MCSGSLDLVRIIVQTDDIAPSESRNFSGRLAHTATDIKHSHRVIDVDPVSKVVLMARKCLKKGFPRRESTEMERLCPALFVQIGSKVVVAGYHDQQESLFCTSSTTHLLTKDMYLPLRTSLATSSSRAVPLASQWPTYSRVTSLWVLLSFLIMDMKALRSSEDLPCINFRRTGSCEIRSSVLEFAGAIAAVFYNVV